MNPEENTIPPRCSPSGPNDISHHASLSATSSSPAVIQTSHSSVTVLSRSVTHPRASPGHGGGLELDPAALPASGFVFRSWSQSSLVSGPTPPPPPCPAPAAPTTPLSCQVSVIVPSPDLRPSPPPARCSSDAGPDLECSVCFSQFNNVFRCPKMLQCKHTFCLECLARINIKSAEPDAIQCPLCRGLTPLPALGLPRLATNADMLSYLPAAMQKVYSIRFLRNKGKLQVKRSSEGHRQWGQRSLSSLDVGFPSPAAELPVHEDSLGDALLRLTGRPGCRAFLLTSVVLLMLLLMGIVVFVFVKR